MTATPMSSFKHGMMCKPDKVALRNHLITTPCEMKKASKQVLGGGSLMHKVRWEKDFKSFANNMYTLYGVTLASVQFYFMVMKLGQVQKITNIVAGV